MYLFNVTLLLHRMRLKLLFVEFKQQKIMYVTAALIIVVTKCLFSHTASFSYELLVGFTYKTLLVYSKQQDIQRGIRVAFW